MSSFNLHNIVMGDDENGKYFLEQDSNPSFSYIVVTVKPHVLSDCSTISYAVPCLRGQCRLLPITLCFILYSSI